MAELVDLFTGLSPTHHRAGRSPAGHRRRSCGEAGRARRARRRAATLADVAAISPAVAAALQGYQELWGQRAVRYEVACPTVVERPEWLLRQLQGRGPRPSRPARTCGPATRGHAGPGRGSPARHARQQLAHPPPLARARRVFPLREGNEAATIGVPGRRPTPARPPHRRPARPLPPRGRRSTSPSTRCSRRSGDPDRRRRARAAGPAAP